MRFLVLIMTLAVFTTAEARTSSECFQFSFNDSPSNGCGGRSQNFLLNACMNDANSVSNLASCKRAATTFRGMGCYDVDQRQFNACIGNTGAGARTTPEACTAAVATIDFGYAGQRKQDAFAGCLRSGASIAKIADCATAVNNMDLVYHYRQKLESFLACL